MLFLKRGSAKRESLFLEDLELPPASLLDRASRPRLDEYDWRLPAPRPDLDLLSVLMGCIILISGVEF